MNKNLLMYSSVIVAIGIGLFVVFNQNEDYSYKYSSIAINEKVMINEKQKDVAINYEITNQDINQTDKKQIKNNIKYKAIDKLGKFEIAIVNDKDKTDTKSTPIYISGKIDNSDFILAAPSHLVDKSTESKLSIKNLQTGKISVISAPFLNDLATNTTANRLEINSNDVENYKFEKVVGDLPSGPSAIPSELPPTLPNN